MEESTRSLLALMARENWRGVTSEQLVYNLQDITEVVRDYSVPGYPGTIGYHNSHDDYLYYLEQVVKSITDEIERRRKLTYVNPQYTDREILAAIKEAIPIENVMAWYTEVFLHKKQWTYRCTLHGADNHPSGVIYQDERRAWCYVCNRGGDVFDVVQLFEGVPLPKAVERLARHIGMDTNPLLRKSKAALKRRSVSEAFER